MGEYTITTLGPSTEFLELPFGEPLEQWSDPRIVHVPRGISRHIVRFIRIDGTVYAIKQGTEHFVLREHRLLRDLATRNVPVVQAVGTVTPRRAPGEPKLEGFSSLLITRHLAFSVPYRSLFTGRGLPDLHGRLLDGLAQLFVRLHLAGFHWGDCSLSNTLFRRDAGELAAYLVDAETGELHPSLSSGQRRNDLSIATENIAGELFDLQASGVLSTEVDAIALATDLEPRYSALWNELTSDEVVNVRESYRIDARVRRLNALGYDLEEMEITTEDGGSRLRLESHLVEPGHHQRRLFALTGLQVQENQARRLLADLARFRAKWIEGLAQTGGTTADVPEDLAARRWLDEKFYGVLAQVPAELRAKLPDAELYHEILEHRWFLSERSGRDVGRSAAVRSYVENVLANLPNARVQVLTDAPTAEFPAITG